MNSHISIIDCFQETPANVCFNDFVLRSNIKATYHMVSKYGFHSISKEPTPKAYIVLGSASHLSDNLPWHQELAEFLDCKLKQQIPVLGICFAHQLMADFYGSKIDYIDNNKTKYLDSRSLKFKENFWGYHKDTSINLVYSHSQVIKELSDSFNIIASSDLFPYEIIQHNRYPFTGVQAHPEASLNFLENESSVDDKDLLKKTKQDGDQFLDHFIASLK
jgi:GMP synthase (glutamine-hydrolysing)